MIELRELISDEWQLWRELRLAALAEAPYAFSSRLADWQGEGDRPQRWRARLAFPGSYHVVALLDDEPVGMASGIPTAVDGVVQLISMWVSPTARGQGIGDHLVTAVGQWAIGRRANQIRLCVTFGNERAAALYRRHGFIDTGEPGDLMPDGIHRESIMVSRTELDRQPPSPNTIVRDSSQAGPVQRSLESKDGLYRLRVRGLLLRG